MSVAPMSRLIIVTLNSVTIKIIVTLNSDKIIVTLK